MKYMLLKMMNQTKKNKKKEIHAPENLLGEKRKKKITNGKEPKCKSQVIDKLVVSSSPDRHMAYFLTSFESYPNVTFSVRTSLTNLYINCTSHSTNTVSVSFPCFTFLYHLLADYIIYHLPYYATHL